MKYKTLKDNLKPLAVVALVVFIIGIAAGIFDVATHPYMINKGYGMLVMPIIIGVLLIVFLVYCFSGDYIRKKYKLNGQRFEGFIESAKEDYNGRGENRYYLKISFNDAGKKYRHTEAYIGNPCEKLANRTCSIYKLNGKYIEADMPVKKNNKSGVEVNIPIIR